MGGAGSSVCTHGSSPERASGASAGDGGDEPSDGMTSRLAVVMRVKVHPVGAAREAPGLATQPCAGCGHPAVEVEHHGKGRKV